jgi:hypothetical protein
MTAVLFGTVSALIGIVIGRLWDTRSESRSWRRDQKVIAYQQFAAAFFSMRENLRAVAEERGGAGAMVALKERVTAAGVEWNAAVVAVWMFGSDTAMTKVVELDVEIDRLFDLALNMHFDFTRWHRLREPAQRVFEGYVAAVRTDLSLPPGPAIRFDEPSRPRAPR